MRNRDHTEWIDKWLVLFSIVLTVGGVTSENKWIIGLASILVILYIGSYFHTNYIKRLENIERQQRETKKEIASMREYFSLSERIARLEGNKKAFLDPTSLLIILVLIILLIWFLKEKGII